MTSSKVEVNKLITDLSSADYHGLLNTFSSSQLKDAYEDIELFHKKYILKEIEKEHIPAFDVGTYFHTAILEPDKLSSECEIYDGIRRGAAWDAFKEKNKGKAIITKAEFQQAEGLVRAVQNSPIAMNRISQGMPEVSAFAVLNIVGSQIFSKEKKLILGKYGWEPYKNKIDKGTEITIKVRADLLASDFVLDLKSTSGNAKNDHVVKTKVSSYNYDLSAALYLDIFSLVTGRKYDTFIWTFASKDYYNSKSYIASNNNVMVGRAKYRKAIMNLADGIESNWTFTDSIGILEPQSYELEHIKENGESDL
jgi:exodeoxyribonuclease VIII